MWARRRSLADVGLAIRLRPVAFTRRAGAALAAQLVGPSQMRMIFANPAKTFAVGAFRIHETS
jgi:hypothetical protein